MNSFLSWFLNIVLGDDFVLMVTMFTLVGVAEYYFPAQRIPREYYALNLRYAVVNVFAVGNAGAVSFARRRLCDPKGRFRLHRFAHTGL